MSTPTIFERIIAREIPADIVLEDDDCICFRDIRPHAPVHLLLVPKRVLPRLTDATADDHELLGRLLHACRTVAEKLGFAASGFRVVINDGPDAGQEVPHLHLHILAGRGFGWPPG